MHMNRTSVEPSLKISKSCTYIKMVQNKLQGISQTCMHGSESRIKEKVILGDFRFRSEFKLKICRVDHDETCSYIIYKVILMIKQVACDLHC
ncbi:hypothetical protein HanPI659440_Chr14g0572451 [Helianthus annuus]|nr:hypothetical protein HanPI659440_Chr14g0572451 [Helianthus annuus]